jgi:hypothetical protein
MVNKFEKYLKAVAYKNKMQAQSKLKHRVVKTRYWDETKWVPCYTVQLTTPIQKVK